jgi:hypothetical protein
MRPWLQRTNVWRRVTSPARGAEQLKKGGKRVSAGFARRCRQVQREGRERINVNDDQAPLPMTDQADKRGQLVRHLEEALALADDTPARAPSAPKSHQAMAEVGPRTGAHASFAG